MAKKILYKIVLAGLSAVLLCCNGTGVSPAAPQLPAAVVDYLADLPQRLPKFFHDYVLIGDDPTIKKEEEQEALSQPYIHTGTIVDYRSYRIHFSTTALAMVRDWLVKIENFQICGAIERVEPEPPNRWHEPPIDLPNTYRKNNITMVFERDTVFTDRQPTDSDPINQTKIARGHLERIFLIEYRDATEWWLKTNCTNSPSDVR